jgi:hypothetical protein
MAFVETAGNGDGHLDQLGVLSDTSIADTTLDAQPVPVDTSTCDVPRVIDPKQTRIPSHPAWVSRFGLNPSSLR